MDVQEIVTALQQAFPQVEVRTDQNLRGTIHFIDLRVGDVSFNIELIGSSYGLTILDEDSLPFTGPDCSFGHVPTLIKYMQRLAAV